MCCGWMIVLKRGPSECSHESFLTVLRFDQLVRCSLNCFGSHLSLAVSPETARDTQPSIHGCRFSQRVCTWECALFGKRLEGIQYKSLDFSKKIRHHPLVHTFSNQLSLIQRVTSAKCLLASSSPSSRSPPLFPPPHSSVFLAPMARILLLMVSLSNLS